MVHLTTLSNVPVLGFILSLLILSSRYYTSASYERPIHLGILILITSGAALEIFSRYSLSNDGSVLRIFQPASNAETSHSPDSSGARDWQCLHILKDTVFRIRRISKHFVLLVGSIVLRILLFWLIVRTPQCGSLGFEAFLPFSVLLCDTLNLGITRPSKLDAGDILGVPHVSRRRGHTLIYGLVALAWGFAAISALDQSRTSTGTVCPPSWQYRPLILSAQIMASVVDAMVLIYIRDLRDNEVEERKETFRFLALALLTSAFSTFLVVFPTLLTDSGLFWTFCPHWPDVADLAIDSLLASIAVMSGLSFLHLVHPTTMALFVSTLWFSGYHFVIIGTGFSLPVLSLHSPVGVYLVAATLLGALCCLTLHPPRNSQSSMASFVHRCFVISSIGTCILCLLVPSFVFGSAGLSLSRAIEELTAAAGISFKFWEGQAATSQTLREASSEYKRRYGLLPPPNFDRWLEFALDNDSPIIDHFDQIYDDLLPFWGIEPATIRRRTGHLFDYSALEMGQLRIRNGTIEISPHIPGSHRWMMVSMQRMIEPFATWLPDMDIAMNLADECRMAIPYGDMRATRDEAQRAMANMMRPGQDIRTNTTTNSAGSQWSSTFTEPLLGNAMSTYFSNNIRWQLYYDFIAPSCPPDSLARKKRWWDWSTVCEECMHPHSILTNEGPLVDDARLARDLCHQPDMAYLDGFIASPSMMVGTNTLFPIFSQGRVGGFSDIMIPSPWNFDQKTAYNESFDRAWDDKLNSLFWRGSSTDGYAAYGTWMGFSRARFVHEAYQKKTKSSGYPQDSSINVSYAGSLSRCHEADCDMESHTFRTWAAGMHATGQQESGDRHDSDDLKDLSSYVTPFEDNWKFRHLIDLDGAGFSGRFLPFLKSQSLVYRAALFQTWFDERLTAWHHYIPVDVRLGSGFWALFEFFSNKGETNSASGDEHARKIAEQGQQWAQKALRPVDMQIYTFRLLLEWGRIIDDDREHLGLEE